MTTHQTQSHAALAVLIILQLTMLGSLFTQTAPHPPLAIPLFALGPFLGAALAIAIAALILGGTTSRSGAITSIIAAVLALISFGPQKWLDPMIGQIWPAVLLGEIAAVILVLLSISWFRLETEETA